MRRLARILVFGFFTSLFLATCFAWSRSHGTLDVWSRIDSENTLRAVLFYQGGIHVVHVPKNSRPRPLGHDAYEIPDGATLADVYASGIIHYRRLGFAKLSSIQFAPPPKPGGAPNYLPIRPPSPATRGTVPMVVARLTPWLAVGRYQAWVVPCWVFVVLFSIVPTVMMVRWGRRRVRRGRGACPDCGYDLRATPEQCPECGAGVSTR